MLKTINLYLDDIRIPKENGFIIVRSYDAFVDHINKYGIPAYISFDHDIASYNKDGTEKTGLDAARFVVNYCLDNDVLCPNLMYILQIQ